MDHLLHSAHVVVIERDSFRDPRKKRASPVKGASRISSTGRGEHPVMSRRAAELGGLSRSAELHSNRSADR
jgi:hypothetical protein